jgi:uncharacterized repeat protein (TIGR03803 family)
MARLNVWKVCLLVVAASIASPIASQAQSFKTLVNFDGTDGSNPLASLTQGTNGNLYGTTFLGGESKFCRRCGTIFSVTTAGKLTSHNFCLQAGCTDGSNPYAGLLLATDGNLYGVTSSGGVSGDGTIFKITPGGKFTTLHSFDSTNGADPLVALVEGTDGNLYGTTRLGGSNGLGTFFRITLGGTFTKLHDFDMSGNGPSGLVQATNGNFYGTTSGGGTHNSGTVFRISKDGTLKTLYNFCVHTICPDGAFPLGSLVQAADGKLYGTTSRGGINNNGTIFTITLLGTLTYFYAFCAETLCADGTNPDAGLVQATDGNFYGTTSAGGASGYGTLFQITPKAVLTTLHSFDSAYANESTSELFQATNGKFYGTTYLGGTSGNCQVGWCGTVFSLDVGLGPFVRLIRDSGRIGSSIGVLGQGLNGATAVSINGTPASFTILSDTYLKATVPAGATTGFVTVNTPSDTLSSNKIFRVKP